MNIERRYKPMYLAPKDRHSQLVDVRQINVAFEYLLTSEPHKKSNPYICIGSGDKTRAFLKRVNLPPLPLLKDNASLRESLKPREKSPLFRIVASQLAFKFQDLKQQIKDARKFDPPKYPVLYRLEPAIDGEIPNDPLTWEDYQVFCSHE